MPWEEAIKAKLAIDEDTKITQKNLQKNAGTVAPNMTAQRENYAQCISRRVGSVESCHLFSVKCRSKKKDGKDSDANSNLSELLTTQIVIRKCSMPIISQRLTSMTQLVTL